MSIDIKDWLNPWPKLPNRRGGAVGKRTERTMFGVVGEDSWSPRTVIRETAEGTVMMKTGGGMVSIELTRKKAPVANNAIFPLTERDYLERTYAAERSTLPGSATPCISYTPITHFLMLDINGNEVAFDLKGPP